MKHERTWHLFDHGLLAFARPAEPPSTGLMLVSKVDVCTLGGCMCRDVRLLGVSVEIGAEFNRDQLDAEKLREQFAGDAVMNARLDIDLGTVTPADQQPLCADWIEYLQAQIDGELLDALNERWNRLKGIRRTKGAWKPGAAGELVAWGDVEPACRQDLFFDGELVYEAIDLYCVEPGCECREVVIDFASKSRGVSVGIRFDVLELAVAEWIAAPELLPLARRLWNAYGARHRRLSEYLSHRISAVREFATSSHRVVSVGKYDPCPCGSGTKYKWCCEPKDRATR